MQEGFIEEYFVKYLWEHKGYNVFNTFVYAIIALVLLYLIYCLFKKYNIKIDKRFILNIIPFILLGSTLRVITDSIDTGVMGQHISNPVCNFIINSHIYDYGYLTVTPGIYIVIAVFLFISLAMFRYLKIEGYFGLPALIIWVPHFLVILMLALNVEYAVLILLFAAVVTIFAHKIRKRYKLIGMTDWIVFAQGLDGAATFVSIDIFNSFSSMCKIFNRCYAEQHVLPSLIGTHSYFLFFVIKVGIAFFVSYYLSKEKEITLQQRNFIALIIIIIGLAPGMRDLLRLLVGA